MVTKKYKIAGKHVEHNDSTSQALFLGGGRTEKSDGKHDKFWAKTTFEFHHRYGKVTIGNISDHVTKERICSQVYLNVPKCVAAVVVVGVAPQC